MKPVNKYQFFISYQNAIKASAASKPLLDTRDTLKSLGYADHSLSFKNDFKTPFYYLSVLFKFIKFFFTIKKGSFVATQYPTPTVGYLLIYFIKLAALRGVYFIAIIHDIETLRAKEFNKAQMHKEINILSAYNGIIVHNDIMAKWLKENGLNKKTKSASLNFFDYVSSSKILSGKQSSSNTTEIAFAGHLEKSLFVYHLDHIHKWKFNIYGGDFKREKNKNLNTVWKGEFSPDEIVYHLEGSFGLVWDGVDSNDIDTNRFGNYMKYNNPFKFSLYLAAGLPVIAPKTAAIANTITTHNIGFLINKLEDLNNIEISDEDYLVMKENVKSIQKNIISGNFMKAAVRQLEHEIKADV